jgi:hypothetical protein
MQVAASNSVRFLLFFGREKDTLKNHVFSEQAMMPKWVPTKGCDRISGRLCEFAKSKSPLRKQPRNPPFAPQQAISCIRTKE